MSTDKPTYIVKTTPLRPSSMLPQRHIFYHMVLSDQQKEVIEATLTKLGITFRREQNPIAFDSAKKQLDQLQRYINTEQSNHGQTRKLRQMEKDALESINLTCEHNLDLLTKQALRESPNAPQVFLRKHQLFEKFLHSTMDHINKLREKVKKEQEEYLRTKRIQQEELKLTMLNKGYGGHGQGMKYKSIKIKPTTTPKPKDEGSINALDLMGGDDEDNEEPESSISLFDREIKEEVDDDARFSTKDDEKFNGVTATASIGEKEPINIADLLRDASTPPELQCEDGTESIETIDEDQKPPILDMEGSPNMTPKSNNNCRRVVYMNQGQESLAKRPRILGSGITYRVLQQSSFESKTNRSIKYMSPSERTLNTVSGLPVTLRPSSSTNLPRDMRNKLIQDGLNQHETTSKTPVPRVDSVVFRKDYKHPPAPLPADDGTHVLCHLCQNRIMCTRLSNLTNHVRRHSAVKQYQCAHCSYQHNEQAKVRLHMSNNHDDIVSQPQDNLTPEMQKIWSLLMDECFPGYMDQLRETHPGKAQAIDWGRTGVGRKGSDGPNIMDGIHSCTECGEAIAVNYIPAMKSMNQFEPLVDHLSDNHLGLCQAYGCSDCGYVNIQEWILQWHIAQRHPKSDCEIKKEPLGGHMTLFLYKFFPTIQGVLGPREDKEEEELEAAGCDINVALSIRSTSPIPTEPLFKNVKEEEEFDEMDKKNEVHLDRSALGPNSIVCELCLKVLEWTNKATLCSLLAHAKRHFKIKQFQCIECKYASSESAHVKNHMLQRHNVTKRPKENNNEFMQTSWLTVMRRCFPGIQDRIDSFKFKTAKSYAEEETAKNQQLKAYPKRERKPKRRSPVE